MAGLDSVRPPGRPAKLGAEQLSQLSEYIDQQSRLAIGDDCKVLIFKRISNERKFGVAYELSNVYRLLRELGFSWITSRSRHPKQDGQVQEAFKNFQLETILNIPGHVALANVDVWFQGRSPVWSTKYDYPTVGQAAVAPSYSATKFSTSISSVPSALQPGQRKPCSVLW